MRSCPVQRSLGRRKYGTYYLNRHWPNQILRLPVIGSLHLCNNVAVGIHRSKISVRLKKKYIYACVSKSFNNWNLKHYYLSGTDWFEQ